MTSIASSLGKRFTVLRYDWDQSFFFINIVDDCENFFRHVLNRPHAFHLVVEPKLLVILHQRVCFFLICPEPLAYQVLTVVRTVKQAPPAYITDAVDFRSVAESVVDFAATRAYPPSCQAPCQRVGVRSNLDNEKLIVTRNRLIEGFCLLDGTRVAVEDEAVFAVITLYAIRNDPVDDRIADQLSRIHLGLSFASKRRVLRYRLAQHVPRGDL